jgi:hypothetical protein
MTVLFPGNRPLPAKLIYQVLEPSGIVAQFGTMMQTAVDRPARQRRLPVLG